MGIEADKAIIAIIAGMRNRCWEDTEKKEKAEKNTDKIRVKNIKSNTDIKHHPLYNSGGKKAVHAPSRLESCVFGQTEPDYVPFTTWATKRLFKTKHLIV